MLLKFAVDSPRQMTNVFYMILPLFIIVASIAGSTRVVMIFVQTEWLGVALSIPVSVALMALIFRLICRSRKSTIPVSELEAIWRECHSSDGDKIKYEIDEIKYEIDNGAEIVRETTSPLSWRMLWGREEVYLARNGKKIRTLYTRMN
jgi:hypothetical protein